MNHPDSLSQSNLPVTSIFALWPMSAGATLASLHFTSFHLRTISSSSPSLSIVVLTVRLPKQDLGTLEQVKQLYKEEEERWEAINRSLLEVYLEELPRLQWPPY